MRNKIFLICLSIAFSLFAYGQTPFKDTIKTSDFSQFPHCEKYDHWKFKGRDTSLLKNSYQFDEKENLIRKIKFTYHGDPRELTAYSYSDKKNLITEATFKESFLEDIFHSFQNKCFYNENGLLDSMDATSSYPAFDYLPLNEKDDSLGKDIKVFDEPILSSIDSSVGGAIMTYHGKMVTGHTKVKKRVVLNKQVTYTAAVFRFYYNDKGQIIRKYMDCDGSNFSGNTFYSYNEKGRFKEIWYYYQNSYKLKNGAYKDSIYKWRDSFYGDSTYATMQVQEKIKKELADTLIRYNASFTYNNDGSTIETVVLPNSIYKLIYYRNKDGQVVKSIFTRTFVQNQYLNDRYIPTDTKTLPDSAFSLNEKRTCVYQYDALGRIAKITENSIYNDDVHVKEYERYFEFKYRDNRALKLPESEYVDFIDEDQYMSEQLWPYHH